MDAPHSPGWAEGLMAVEMVRSSLAAPGWAAIDMETWPHPDHEVEQAVARTLRGGKGAARKAVKLQFARLASAHHRVACTLQVAHENGQAVFARLASGEGAAADAARADQLQAMFAPRTSMPPWEDHQLVAFNALFEAELLAKHGVVVDLDDPMLAAKALYLLAVPEDRPQPVQFSLAALVEREFGKVRDKTLRARDWRSPPDAEAVTYGIEDAKDALALWQLYRQRLEAEGLMLGYRVMVEAVNGTAASNLVGLTLDKAAHAALMQRMQRTAADLKTKLDEICNGDVKLHSSTAHVSMWIIGEVLGYPLVPPDEPKLVGLLEFLRQAGGLSPDRGGELAARDLGRLVSLTGKLNLEEATLDAWQAGYIGLEHSTFGDERPEQDELLEAIDRERFGDRVLTLDDQLLWDAYLAQKENFERLHKADPYLKSSFDIRLRARANTTWRWTAKTGHLAITKGSKARKAEQLSHAFPQIAEYLVTHSRWNKARKLIEAFGPALPKHWQDEDGRVRGQFKVWAAVTGRQSCVNPNLQQMPREAEFRALFVAPPGRKLIVCDYSQIEMRLAAIFARDEVLLDVYRRGADIHAANAAIIFGVLESEVTKAQRQAAKPVGFAVIYGAGAAGLAESTGVEIEQARVFLARFLGAYHGLAAYRERAVAEARARGWIEIIPARRVWIDAQTPATCMINFPIQGTAASVQMRAVRRVFDALRARPGLADLAACVHDEILLEANDDRAEEAQDLLQREMRRALVEIVPAAVDMGADLLAAAVTINSWAEKP